MAAALGADKHMIADTPAGGVGSVDRDPAFSAR
jgi:hypothetical protein